MTKAQVQMIRGGALVVLAAVIILTIWKWNDWRATGQAGSAYAVRLTCSCRYIQGRSAQSCAQDVANDAGSVTIEADDKAKRISGHVPMLGSASAVYRPGFGCLMEQQ